MSREMTVEELSAELRALRETPSERFAAALDARATAGFPRHGASRLAQRAPGAEAARRLARRLRSLKPRRMLMPALAGTATVIVAATAIVISTEDSGPESEPSRPAPAVSASGGAAEAGVPQALRKERSKLDSVLTAPGAAIAPAPLPAPRPAAGVRDRQVERSAQLTLGTDPEQVQQVAGKAIDVVGRYRGFVLSSSVRDGSEGDAGASFELLIPSGRLSPALADLSAIAEVRSRSENSLDITAPFVSAREHLRDARAEAEGLLGQLADADTETERESVKAQLRIVRDRIALHRSQVQRLERRADFSRVSLQVVTGEGAVTPFADGGWTIDDALHDAGRVLAVAAGVTVVGAAILLPLALLGGGAWTARRVYLRRAREQTLGA
jgi:Domain of unknown function (DUF4349)